MLRPLPMASPDDFVQTTSYSDPFYDRLEAASQYVRRFKWAMVLLILAVIGLVIVINRVKAHRPEAAAAAKYLAAVGAQEAGARTTALEALAGNDQVMPLFRARAAIELTQTAIIDKKPDVAKTRATESVKFASEAGDPETLLAAKLSLAGVLLDAGDNAGAGTLYGEVESGAGGRYPAQSLEAQMGVVRVAIAEHRLDDAIQKLDGIKDRPDAGADLQLNAARILYWNLKRQQEEAKLATASASAAATAASSAADAGSVRTAATVSGTPVEAPAIGSTTPAGQ